MLGKRLIKSGADAAAGALVPSEHFETVTYTGNGGTQRIGGYINRGGLFNGSSSYINLGDTPALRLTGSYTVSLWVNFNSFSTFQRIIAKDNANDYSGGYALNINSTNIYWQHNKGSVNDVGYAHSFSTGTWYHIAVTYDSSTTTNNLKLYVNGSNVSTVNADSPIIGESSNYLFFGTYGSTSPSGQYLNGKLDQVRFFNKALSSGEVSTLYGETYASSTVSTTDIFNNNSGVALYQLDGNANDTGGVSGKFGEGGIFNGSSSIINLANNSFNLTTVSVSFWLKLNSITGEDYVLDVYDETGSVARGYAISTDSSNKIKFRAWDNLNFAEVFSSTTLSLNTWYHIVITGIQNSASVYINGSLDNSGSLNGFSFQSQQSTSIGAFRATPGSSSINFLDGILDDVRIYSDVLTSTEVGYLYNNTTASIPTDNLKAYYKLDGDARDEQQQYDGTATNVSYAYNGTATNVTYQEATKFTPDLIWVKTRNQPYDHNIVDSVRGTTKYVRPNRNIAEVTQTDGVLSFDSNGFTVDVGGDFGGNGNNYVAWCFKGGSTAVSNTNGSITSQVSANTTAGFSIVKHTAPSSEQNYTIGHGLSQKPDMVILKGLDSASAWFVWHKDLSVESYYLYLHLTSNESGLTQDTRIWGQQSFTDTVISTRANYTTTLNQDYISYCFHSVDGFSKVGSYTGTGASGNRIETGFEPAWVMIKSSSNISDWYIIDNERPGGNPSNKFLIANGSGAEYTASESDALRFYSNGFEVGSQGSYNNSGYTWIYFAIAADPDTTTPTVQNSFDVVTYAGTSSGQSISTDFKPDLVWIKNRSAAFNHALYDSVRGAEAPLFSNTTAAQDSDVGDTYGLKSFDSSGFTLGYNGAISNTSGNNFVAWCWKAGDHDDNLPQINTEGTINSIVSVNAAAGFSIVKYTSNGSYTSSDTIGHGLSQAPDLVIWKPYSGTTSDWFVQYQLVDGSVDYLILNATDAKRDSASTYLFQSNVLVNYAGANGQNVIAYCFHSVSGYQKVGTYSGTGVSGQTITTGFQPRFVLIKATNLASDWYMIDAVRPNNKFLAANKVNSEYTSSDTHTFTSTGFTLSGESYNNSGYDWIYLAIK